MKRSLPLSARSIQAPEGNKVRFVSRLSWRSPLALVLISFVAAATLITFAVSANRKANSGPGVSPVNHAQDARATKPLTRIANPRTVAPMSPMFAPVVTATLTDNITSATKVIPGGTINYTAVISNTTTDATGVQFTDTLDANTTSVGSPVVSPIAFNDTYAATGNVQISVAAGSGLLVNDFMGSNPAGTITASDVASTQGGTVAVNAADGAFTYTPPANFTGTDTFTYTLSNSAASSVGTVTITVTDRVLFVSSAGVGAANCRPATTCTLATADALAAPTGKDLVFVTSGTYSSAAISLNSAQTIAGQAITFAQALSDATITLAPNSVAPVFGASTTPVLNNAGTIVTLGGNNLVEDLSINPSAGNGILGNNITTGATIRNLTVTGTGAANGINLTGTSTGSTFNLSNIGVTTASGNALSDVGPGAATTGGTINATQDNSTTINTLASTTGIALNLVNTTIGASGVTFRSIAANGGSKGIVLNNTGATAGLTVTGTSTTASTGGTIQNISTRGGEFITTKALSLKNMNFTNANTSDGGTCTDLSTSGCNADIYLSSVTTATLDNVNISGTTAQEGINGVTVSDFSLLNSTIANCGAAVEEGCVKMRGLTGTAAITNSNISFPGQDVVEIVNSSGSLLLNVNSSTFRDSQASGNGGNGIQMRSEGTANTIMNVNSCTFLRIRTNGIQATAINSATNDVDVTTSTFDPDTGTMIGLDLDADNTGNLKFNIVSNTKIYSRNGPAVNVFGDTNAVINGRINNNADVKVLNNVGSNVGSGIRANINKDATARIEVKSNTVNVASDDAGIDLTGIGKTTANPGGATNTLDATVTGNNVTIGATSTYGIFTISASNAGDTNAICMNVASNVVTRNPSSIASFRARVPSVNGFYRMNGFTTNAENTWNANGNTPVSAGGSEVSFGGSGTFGSCTATLPTNPTITPSSMYRPETNRLFEVAQNDQTTQPVESTSGAMSSGSNASSTTFSWLMQAIHPITAFAAKLNFLNSNRSASTDRGLSPRVSKGSGSMIEPNGALPDGRASARSASAAILPQKKGVTPQSGETIGPISIGTLPIGKSVTIKYQATVNAPPLVKSVSTQGTVSGGNFSNVLTDDPEPVGASDPTVTNIDVAITWTGALSTDWNTAGNWNLTGPVTSTYAPGVSNPAINDVIIPSGVLPNEPNIGTTDIGIFSLNISNGRTLTIGAGRILTIGGGAGSDLTLDGIISGGALQFGGAGPHVINNAGGTGSLSSTNLMTVLSGSTVNLNNNLQMGALTVIGGSIMNITNRTLSLNGAGAALSAAGSFTTTGSTVVFNGSAAQTTGTIYNNLTINNAAGVTLTGNSTVNGTLALTSGDLNTGAFTLTQPNTTASTGAGDVVGTVKRTGGPFGLISLTFGNPNNILTFTGAGTRPTDVTVLLAKVAPATYAAAVQRNYTISQTGGSGFTATVRLRYLDPELNLNTPEANLNLRRLTGGLWKAQTPTTVDSVNNFVESTGVAAVNLATQWTFSTLAPTATGSTVSGQIVDNDGNPVEGAVVRLSGTQNRKTITDTRGNYSFADVETNGFYTVTPSRVNYNFAPATRGFSALGAQTEASFAGAYNGNHLNPLDTTEYFVRQQYLDFLGREPEEKGFNDWTDTINNCASGDASCDRVHVSEMFFRSEEFQQRGYFVYRFYSAALGRKPDYAEFTPDMSRVSGFLDATQLEAAKTAFANDFTSRAAFVNQYGTLNNAAYVDALTAAAGVSLSNRQALIESLDAGTLTRAQALRQIAESGEAYARYYNQAFVVMEYFGYLRRDPDILYLNWIDVLNQGGDSRHMVEGFVDATEYRNRFQR